MSDWDTLSSQLMALDFASGANVSTPLDLSGDADDAASHLDTLDNAADKVRAAWKRVQNGADAEKKKVQHAARDVLDTSKALTEEVIRHLPHTVAAQALNDRATQVATKLKQTAKDVLPWYLAVGMGMWILIGVGAYLYLEREEKRTPAQ
jgi:hypothetical protein